MADTSNDPLINALLEDLKNATIIHGENSIVVAKVYTALGEKYLVDKRLLEARDYFTKSLNMLSDLLGSGNEDVIDAHYRLGKVISLQTEGLDNREARQHALKTRQLREQFDASIQGMEPSIEIDEKYKITGDIEPVSHKHRTNITNTNSIDSTLIYSDLADEAKREQDYDTARQLYSQCLDLRKKKYGARSPAMTPVMMSLAEVYKLDGNYKASQSLLDEVLSITNEVYGFTSEPVADTLHSLGHLLRLKGDLEAAEPTLMEALKIRRMNFGDYHPNIGSTLNNLADVFREKDDFLRALQFHSSAVEAFEKSVGKSHTGYINALGNMGITLRRQAVVGLGKGEELVKSSLEFFAVRGYESNHPWVSKFNHEQLTYKAQKLFDEGKYSQAVDVFSSVIASKTKEKKAKKSLSVADLKRPSQEMKILVEGRLKAQLMLAKELIKKSFFEEADELLGEGVACSSSLLGPDFSLFSVIALLRADLALKMGRYDAARTGLLDVLTQRTDSHGPDHVEVAEVMVPLGEWHLLHGLFTEAETFLSQALVLIGDQLKREPEIVQSSGTSSYTPIYTRTLSSIADLFFEKGTYSHVLPTIKQLGDICNKSFDRDDPVTLRVLSHQANRILIQQGKYNQASAVLLSILDTQQRLYGMDAMHFEIATTLKSLGYLELVRGADLDLALKYTASATDMLHIITGNNEKHVTFLELRHQMGEILYDKGSYSEAAQRFSSCVSGFIDLSGEESCKYYRSRYSLAMATFHISLNFAEAQKELAYVVEKQRGVASSSSNYYTDSDESSGGSRDDNIDVIKTLVALGEVFTFEGKYGEALRVFTKALSSSENVFRTLNPTAKASETSFLIIDCKLSIAHLKMMCGVVAEAAELVGSAGIALSRLVGVANTRASRCLLLLGELISVYKAKYKDARALISRSIAHRAKMVGGDVTHPLVADALLVAIDNVRAPGYLDIALADCDRLIDALASQKNSDETTATRAKFYRAKYIYMRAKIYLDLGRVSEAEPLIAESLAFFADFYNGENSPLYLSSLVVLAHVQREGRRFERSAASYSQALQLAKGLYGEAHPTSADIYRGIALLALATKKEEDAIVTLEKNVVVICERIYGNRHPESLYGRGLIGLCRNLISKGSGNRAINDTLAEYERYNQLKFTAVQPWVVDLGGFTGSADEAATINSPLNSAYDNIRSSAALWSLPTSPHDDGYGQIPKDHTILTNTDSPISWGSVSYTRGTISPQNTPEKESLPITAITGGGDDEIEKPAINSTRSMVHMDTQTDFIPGAAYEVLASAPAADGRECAPSVVSSFVAVEALEIEPLLVIETPAPTNHTPSDAVAEAFVEPAAAADTADTIERLLIVTSESAIVGKGDEGVQSTLPSLPPPLNPVTSLATSLDKDTEVSSIEERQITGSYSASNPNPNPNPADSLIPLDRATDRDILESREAQQVQAVTAAEFLLARASKLFSAGGFANHSIAQPLLEEACVIRRQYFPDTDGEIEALLLSANNLHALCRWPEASDVYQRCHAIMSDIASRKQGYLEPVTQLSCAMARNFVKRGLYFQAQETLNSAQSFIALKVEATHALMGLLSLGQSEVSLMLGLINDAKTQADKGYTIINKAYGNRHVAISDCLCARAAVLAMQAKYNDAKPLLDQALIIRRDLLGQTHTDVAACYLQQAIIFMDQGRCNDADSRLKMADEIYRSKYKNDRDVRLADIAQLQAIALCKNGHYVESAAALRDIIGWKESLLEPGHCLLADSYLALSDVLALLGDLHAALDASLRALEIRQTSFAGGTKGHPALADAMHAVGDLHRCLGNFDKAKVELEAAEEMRRYVFTKNHPKYFTSQHASICLLLDLNNYESAIKNCEKLMKARSDSLGDDHPDYGDSLHLYARILHTYGDIDSLLKAKAVAKEAVSLRKMNFGPSSMPLSETIHLQCAIELALLEPHRKSGERPKGAVEAAGPETEGSGEEDTINREGDAEEEELESSPAADEAMEFEVGSDGVPIFPTEPFEEVDKLLKTALASLTVCVPKIDDHAFGIFVSAFFGAIKRSSFDAEARFVERLPMHERKLFREKQKLAELSAGVKNDEGESTIPGMDIIESAISRLKTLFSSAPNTDKHPYIVQLRKFTSVVVVEKTDSHAARSNYKLAEAARRMGQYYEAEKYYTDSFSQQVDSLGALAAGTSIEVADILLGRAENLRALGRYSSSQACYVQFIVICEKTCGSESALTAKGYFGLAELLRYYGKFDDARALHEKVLMLRVRCLGSDRTLDAAQSHRAAAELFLDTGLLDLAEKHAMASLEMREQLHPSGIHDEVVESMLTLARLYLTSHRIADCSDILNRALQLAITLRGGNHPLTANCFYLQSLCALELCDFTTANNVSKKAIKIFVSFFGDSAKKAETNRGNGRFFEILDKLTKSQISVGVDVDSARRGRDKQDCYDLQTQQLLECGAFVYAGNTVECHPCIAAALSMRAELALAMGKIADSIEMYKYSKNMLCDVYGCLNFGAEAINAPFGRALIVQGDFKMAQSMIKTLRDMTSAELPESHPLFIDAMRAEGDLCLKLNKMTMCEVLLPKSLELSRALYGQGHPRVALSLIANANFLTLKSAYCDAATMYGKAMQILKKAYAEVHLSIALSSYYEAAGALASGSYAHAAALLDQAIGIGSMLLGESHYLVHLCLHSLAELQRLQGKFLLARKTAEQTLAGKLESLGPLHPDTVGTVLLMAHVYKDLAKYALAAKVYVKIVRFIRRCYGKDHVVLADALRGLAEVRVLEGDSEEGRILFHRVLLISRNLFGEPSSGSRNELAAATMQSLAEIMAVNGHLGESEKQLDSVFALRRGEEKSSLVSRPVASSLASLGDIYLLRGKVVEARTLFDRCLSMRRSLLGSDHPEVVETHVRLAHILQASGKLQQAAEAYSRCYEILRESTGATHPLIGTVLGCRGLVLTRLGSFAEAYSLLSESVSIKKLVYEKHYPRHIDLLEGYYNLAEYYKSTGNYGNLTSELIQQEKIGRYVMSFDDKLKMIDEKSTLQAAVSVQSSPSSIKSGKSMDSKSVASAVNKILAVDICDSVVESTDTFEDDKIRGAVEEEVLRIMNDPGQFATDADKATAVPFLVFEKIDSAMEIYKNVLDVQISHYGVEHPRVIKTQFAIAENLKLSGVFGIAMEVFEHVYGARKKLYGDSHVETAEAMCGLADMLRAVAKFFPTVKEKGKGDATRAAASVGRIAGPKLEEHIGSIIGTSGPLLSPLKPKTNLSPLNEAIRDKTAAETLIIRPPKKVKSLPACLGGYMGYAFPNPKNITRVLGIIKNSKASNLDAKALYDNGIAIVKGLFGDACEHPLLADLIIGKAELYRGRGDCTKALPLIQTALSMRRRLYSLSHPSVAMCVNLMAELLRMDSRYADAITLYKKSIEILREVYANGYHPSVAEVTNNLAMCYYGYGRYTESKMLYEEAISLRKQLLGEHHPAVAQSSNNFASLLHIIGRHSEAEKMYQEALSIKKLVFGVSHPDVATVMNNYALLLKAMGRLDESETYYSGCIKIQKETLGDDHPDLASTYNNLAALYVEKNQLVEAMHLCRKSIDMKRKVFGFSSVVVAGALTNYAGLLYNMKEYADAMELYKEALTILKNTNGDSHPSVAESLNNIAMLHFVQEDYDQAKVLFEQSLQIKVSVYGGSNPAVVPGYTNLAGCLLKVGLLKEARDMYRRALDLKTRQVEADAEEAASSIGGVLPEATGGDGEMTSIELNISAIDGLLEYERNNNDNSSSCGSPADSSKRSTKNSPLSKKGSS